MVRSLPLIVAFVATLCVPATASAVNPVVDFTSTPALPTTNDLVTFTATATDADGDLDTLAWDFNSDGEPELSGPALLTSTVTWPFRTPGVQQVTVTAVDLTLGMASTNHSVTVVTASPVTEPTQDDQPVSGAGSGQAFDVPASAVAGTTARGSVRLRLLAPFPVVRLRGRVVGGGAAISRLTVDAPRGARVRVTCSGGGCFKRSSLVKVARRAQILRFHGMERRLRVGAVVEIFVGRDRAIGKYTRFVIRRNAVPDRRDRCVVTLSRSPSTCPSP